MESTNVNASPTVVVGCDGSPENDPALRFATREAELHHARLVVVTAYEQPIDPDLDDFETPDAELCNTARISTETALRRALGRTSAELKVDVICAEGEPSQLLRKYSTNAIMIVVRSHDRPMIQRLFARSIGRELLHGSTVPVTVVPPA